MNDYIKREDAVNAVFESHIHFNEHLRVTERINAIPAADVVERKRGKWSYERVDFSVAVSPGAYVISSPTCSVCGFHEFEATNFCPNCGSDMRKGGES